MTYRGPNRRGTDPILLELQRQLGQIQEREHQINLKVDALDLSVQKLIGLTERWKFGAWLLISLGGLGAWVETQYRLVSSFIAFLIRGGGGGP